MAKGFKVKRYNRIYRGGRSPASRLLHFLGAAAAVCVLGFIGWSAYGPVMDYLSDDTVSTMKPAESSSQTSSPEVSSSEQAAQKDQSTEEHQTPDQSDPSEPDPAPSNAGSDIHGIYLPSEILADASKLEQSLSSVDTTHFNAVYFDLKNEAGNVLYRSHIEEASLASAPFDLTAVCNKIKDKGMTPIGRISAFLDPLAASKIKNAGVKYGNSEILWNDDDPARGGKPWLNPYAAPAQEYLMALAEESIQMGVQTIVYANVCFPTGYSLHLASYGNVTQSRAEVLSAFIDQAEQRIVNAGGTLWVSTSGRDALTSANNMYGEENPLTLSNESVVLDARPVQFGNGIALENFSVDAPLMNPGETIDTLLKSLSSDLSGKKVLAVLQGSTAEGQYTNNKPYTAQDMEDQIAALHDNGINQFIFYSPDGNYPNQEAS